MAFNINRRDFLLSLAALGASYALPAQATAKQVDAVWAEAQANPWYFSVSEWGTIAEPDHPEDETWGDIFGIATSYLKTPRDVINEIHGCNPLINHFQGLADDELDALTHELDDFPAPKAKRRRHIEKLIEILEKDRYCGWEDWIALEGQDGVERFRREIDAWAAEPADYAQSEWFPPSHGAQGQAKAFFEGLDGDTLDALCVVIVEGDHPGSTYFAAELRQDIDAANETAADLGLPFRFKAG